MDAAVIRTLGLPPRCEDFPEPVAGDDEAIVHVHAAALKPVDKQMAAGSHYASPQNFPTLCGTDGVGHLDNGQRVFFGGARPPYGTMAQRTVIPRKLIFPVPEGIDDATAAALPNPGVSAWLSLTYRAQLTPGENVLILGATGVTGKLAVKVAKLLGAGRVVAAGRNLQVLGDLLHTGADRVIDLNSPEEAIREAYVREAGEEGFHVVIDFLWGRPAEVFLAAMTQKDFVPIKNETRFLQVGQSAGATLNLDAAVFRSRALTMKGTAGIPPIPVMADALQQVFARAARGELSMETESVPLQDVESAWSRQTPGRRIVLMP